MRTLIFILTAAIALQAQQFSALQPQSEYQVLANPHRDGWQQPDKVISALQFSPTETIAVIENGYPYFAPRIAPLVKKLYAVNADARAFQGRGALPPSISTIVSTASDPGILGYGLDTIMMVDTLVTINQPIQYYLKAIGGLKPGGRLVIIDRILPSVIPQRTNGPGLISQLPGIGFSLNQTFSFLPVQFFLVFKL